MMEPGLHAILNVAQQEVATPLDDERIDRLVALIQDTFRVREDHDPIYVDVHGHLARVASPQHQIVFGRRGSGKSCLLIHYHRQARKQFDNLSVYVLADEIKTLPYPDLLIRLLLSIFEGVQQGGKWFNRAVRMSAKPLQVHLDDLRSLLDEALSQEIQESRRVSEQSGIDASVGRGPLSASAGSTSDEARERQAQFVENKVDRLERHLQDYKKALRKSVSRSGFKRATILVDDFYLIAAQVQPDVVDYLHRLLRGTPLYMKVGTVRHRTFLMRQADRTIGVELYQDVEEISLDQTFEDVEATHRYLATMLDSMGRKVGIESVTTEFLSPEGLLHLTLASGGVPRDFLTIFVQAVDAARTRNALRWLTPTTVYKGAGRVYYRTKFSSLRSDAGTDAVPIETLFGDITEFCLKEKRKTAFLVAQADVASYPDEHELVQQLMDFKLIHVIEPDTSAASGRAGRYEAYTLDFALFMEPRLRGLEHVEFWKVDEQRRREGVREAPVYPLDRARDALVSPVGLDVDLVREEIEASVGVESDDLADG